jgi:hypothetical protein
VNDVALKSKYSMFVTARVSQPEISPMNAIRFLKAPAMSVTRDVSQIDIDAPSFVLTLPYVKHTP